MTDQPPDTGVSSDRGFTSPPRWVIELKHTFRASPVFAFAVLVTLGLAALNGLMVLIMQLQPGFLGMTHFTELNHRIHDLTFGFIVVPAVIGMLAQLRRPAQNVAGQLMALIPWMGLVLTLLLTLVLTNNTNVLNPAWIGPAAVTLIAAVLHPTGRGFFRSFSVSRVNWLMLVLVLIAAVPLLAFAFTNIERQGNVANEHAGMGHYGFMTAFSFTIIGVGLLASLRPDGWRLAAWVASLLPALLGLASVAYPAVDSSLGLVWAPVAIAWGVVFVAAAELTKDAAVEYRTQKPRIGYSDFQDPEKNPENQRPVANVPGLVKVIGIIGIVLVLLFVGMILFGGGHGPGRHTASSSGIENSGDVGGPADADEAARMVQVTTLDTMTFEPSSIDVAAEETVTFLVTNSGQITHEFTLGDAAAQQEHADKMAEMDGEMVHDEPNSLTLQPGETKQLTWRFGDAGTLEYACHEPGHYEAGMRGEITIN